MTGVAADNVDVSVEARGGGEILIALDRKTDHIVIPWQDAYAFAETLEQAVDDVRDEGAVIDPVAILKDQAQIRVGDYKGKVTLVFERNDRFLYHWRAAELLAKAIRIKAQDLQYAALMVSLPTLGQWLDWRHPFRR
jgi:hypothetical protein